MLIAQCPHEIQSTLSHFSPYLNRRSSMNLHQPPFGDAGPSSYPHPDPSAQRHSAMAASAYDAPSISSFIVSPEMNPHNMSRLSPTIHHPAPQHPMDGHPQAHVMMQYQHMTPAHHPQPQPVPTFSGVNYMPMQRHPSVSTTRSESPHPMMGADVFGGPVNAPMLESGMMVDHPHSQSHLSVGYEYGSVAEVSHSCRLQYADPSVIRIRDSARHFPSSCAWTSSACSSAIPDSWVIRLTRDAPAQEQPCSLSAVPVVVLDGKLIGQ